MPPVGFCGELRMIIRVRSVTSEASSAASNRKPLASRSGSDTGLAPMNAAKDG